jgi:hypothetical protein
MKHIMVFINVGVKEKNTSSTMVTTNKEHALSICFLVRSDQDDYYFVLSRLDLGPQTWWIADSLIDWSDSN